jgi:predicted nucleic acid-binding protein
MLVVSDTSPLCYLLLIDQIDLLPKIYGRVVIPQAVDSPIAKFEDYWFAGHFGDSCQPGFS